MRISFFLTVIPISILCFFCIANAEQNTLSLEIDTPGRIDFKYERKFSKIGISGKSGLITYGTSKLLFRRLIMFAPSISGSYYLQTSRFTFFKPEVVLGVRYFENDEGRPLTVYGEYYFYCNPRLNVMFSNNKISLALGVGIFTGIERKFKEAEAHSNYIGLKSFRLYPSYGASIGVPF